MKNEVNKIRRDHLVDAVDRNVPVPVDQNRLNFCQVLIRFQC